MEYKVVVSDWKDFSNYDIVSSSSAESRSYYEFMSIVWEVVKRSKEYPESETSFSKRPLLRDFE